MAQLADMLAQVRANEIAQAEAEIASCFPPPAKVTPEEQQRVIGFVNWCEFHKVRSLGARPTSVAAFIRWQQDNGVTREKIADSLSAIEAMHFAAGQSNPCATPVVRMVTGGSTVEAPRSWTKEEKQNLWPQLPPDIQQVIARREHDREREMRRAQNGTAVLRQELKRLQAAAATTSADTTTEKETT
jgi:hypothetical protein